MAIPLALLLSISFCSIRTKPRPPVGENLRGKIVELSYSLIGIPYRFGGEDIDGFDCSGLVHYVYDAFGIEVPRTARLQAKIKSRVNLGRAKAGDILVFKLKRNWHTGIFVGRKMFIHSPNRRGRVRREGLDSFWRTRLKGVINIIDHR